MNDNNDNNYCLPRNKICNRVGGEIVYDITSTCTLTRGNKYQQTIPSYHSTTVPLYHCTIIPLYHCTIVSKYMYNNSLYINGVRELTFLSKSKVQHGSTKNLVVAEDLHVQG